MKRARRDAAVDLLVIFGLQGLNSMVEEQPDKKEQLLERLEWALNVAGITGDEIAESVGRCQDLTESVLLADADMDAELAKLLEEGDVS